MNLHGMGGTGGHSTDESPDHHAVAGGTAAVQRKTSTLLLLLSMKYISYKYISVELHVEIDSD